MTALLVSALLFAFGVSLYALAFVSASQGSYRAELQVAVDLLEEGGWSTTETLTVASRGSLDEREAFRWVEVRGRTLFRLACEACPSEEVGPDRARVRYQLAARTSDGEARTYLQFVWPGRSGNATSRDAELLLERIATELC